MWKCQNIIYCWDRNELLYNLVLSDLKKNWILFLIMTSSIFHFFSNIPSTLKSCVFIVAKSTLINYYLIGKNWKRYFFYKYFFIIFENTCYYIFSLIIAESVLNIRKAYCLYFISPSGRPWARGGSRGAKGGMCPSPRSTLGAPWKVMAPPWKVALH